MFQFVASFLPVAMMVGLALFGQHQEDWQRGREWTFHSQQQQGGGRLRQHGGLYYWKSSFNDYCLGSSGSNFAIVSKPCGSSAVKFAQTPVEGVPGAFYIVAEGGQNQCLTIGRSESGKPDAGTPLYLKPCILGANQLFKIGDLAPDNINKKFVRKDQVDGNALCMKMNNYLEPITIEICDPAASGQYWNPFAGAN